MYGCMVVYGFQGFTLRETGELQKDRKRYTTYITLHDHTQNGDFELITTYNYLLVSCFVSASVPSLSFISSSVSSRMPFQQLPTDSLFLV